jgi:CrcB protein
MLGASLRYGLARALPTTTDHFPWATFWTNVSGSLVLGYLLAVLAMRPTLDPRVRLFVATGVLGAFTTMSSYAVETAVLAKDGHGTIAAAYAVTSVALGLVLAAVGVRLGRRRPA